MALPATTIPLLRSGFGAFLPLSTPVLSLKYAQRVLPYSL